jgi:hypothetical protein
MEKRLGFVLLECEACKKKVWTELLFVSAPLFTLSFLTAKCPCCEGWAFKKAVWDK